MDGARRGDRETLADALPEDGARTYESQPTEILGAAGAGICRDLLYEPVSVTKMDYGAAWELAM